MQAQKARANKVTERARERTEGRRSRQTEECHQREEKMGTNEKQKQTVAQGGKDEEKI